MKPVRTFLISAPNSGSGKSTITLAILAALKKRGLKTAPFKSGPDFIDTGYHSAIAGRESINLDSWMTSKEFVEESFLRHSADADISIIEGVMGLFDGIADSPLSGSSAEIAAITSANVIVVIDAKGMAATSAAIVKGLHTFVSEIKIFGVIFNRVGSLSHAKLLENALKNALPEVNYLGAVPRNEEISLASRHLGLVTVDDNPLSIQFIEKLADIAEQNINLELLIGNDAENIQTQSPQTATASKCKIAVAKDEAFSFLYRDNIEILESFGAEIAYFSPLRDKSLPKDTSGIYLPGGYPELYSKELSQNLSLIDEIRAKIECKYPAYAECGGFLYLTKGLKDNEPFVSIFPLQPKMLDKRKALGYREVIVKKGVWGLKEDIEGRGHEFHYSEIPEMPAEFERRYKLFRRGEYLAEEGYCYKNLLASYLHIHFGSNPDFAKTFVDACVEIKKLRHK